VTDEEVFEANRELLFAVAYRMLGTVADAEDVVQDAWLRWTAASRSDIAEPRAYLARTVTHVALNKLRSARAQIEGTPIKVVTTTTLGNIRDIVGFQSFVADDPTVDKLTIVQQTQITNIQNADVDPKQLEVPDASSGESPGNVTSGTPVAASATSPRSRR